MISYITGKIIDIDFINVIILTNSGIGYDIGINELIYSKLALEEEVSLYIHHQKTENNEALFGFLEKDEKKVFSELIKISGVGGKVAMQVLSLGVEKLLLAISNNNNTIIEGIKGIGKKMAEKIILEMKDKDFGINIHSKENIYKTDNLPPNLHSSIKSTLANMGYNPKDIDRVLGELPDEMVEASKIIPFVIRNLS